MEDKGSTWVTPWYPLKWGTKYPPACATICNQAQYVRRSLSILGNTMYPSRIPSCLSQYRASYAFYSSSNMVWRTTSLVDAIFWGSLSSRVTVPIPRPIWKPCNVSWYSISEFRRCLIIPVVAFHMIPTRPIHMKFLHTPLGISTAV